MAKTPKRDLIKNAILKGGATKETLMEAADVNADGFASQCSYLRLTGFYPIVDEDGIYDHTDQEGWEALKAAKAANKKPAASKKSPYDRLEAANKRVARCDKAQEASQLRFEKNEDDRECELRSTIADAQAELAAMELETAQDLYDNTDEADQGNPAEPVEGSEDEELL